MRKLYFKKNVYFDILESMLHFYFLQKFDLKKNRGQNLHSWAQDFAHFFNSNICEKFMGAELISCS